MQHIGDVIRGIVARGKAMCDDPVYQANLARQMAASLERDKVHAEFDREKQRQGRGIPRILWAQLDSGNLQTSCLSKAQAFASSRQIDAVTGKLGWANRDWLLILSGRPGVGKTFAAAHIADLTPGAIFTKAYDIASLSAFDREKKDRLENCRLLVIDDLGSEYTSKSDWSKSYLWQLLDRRYDGMAKTLATSNLGLIQFKATYGDGPGRRLLDRMDQGGEFFEATEGDSLRGVT